MHLILKKNVATVQKWNGEKREYQERDIPYEDFPVKFLHLGVEKVDGATVGDLVKILRSNVPLYSDLLDGSFLAAVLDEKPPKKEDIHKVVFRWACEHNERKGEKDFFLHVDVSGVGPYEGEEIEGYGKKPGDIIDNWALDFTPLNSMLDVPIGLDDNVEMQISKKEKGKKYEFSKMELGKWQFRLHDILFGLVNEFTFHGDPEMRDGTIGMLKQRVEDIESGKEKTIPMEDVMKDFDEDA